jgi:hypothetical protein
VSAATTAKALARELAREVAIELAGLLASMDRRLCLAESGLAELRRASALNESDIPPSVPLPDLPTTT